MTRTQSMIAEDQSTSEAPSAAELLQGGPSPSNGPSRQGPRGLLRRMVLRIMRPHTYHQRAFDEALVSTLQTQEAALARQRAELEHLSTRHSEQIERLEGLARELILTAESLRRGTSEAVNTSGDTRRAVDAIDRALERITGELRAVPYMAGNPFRTFDSPAGEVLGYRSQDSLGVGASEYVAFEEIFRGPTERVTESQRPYVDLIRGHEPVLDVGCGRGEFLALLAAEGIEASGIDSDAGMVQRCRELGVAATQADASEYLAGVADRALGTVFSAQVIEHLALEELRGLLSLSARKLRGGGLFIAETVNPHRIASLKTFWVDLTHRHPIFPEVALAMCAGCGFQSAYVFAPGFDSFETARFEAPSYAVVATAP